MSFKSDFTIAHLGVNCTDSDDARACSEEFAFLFGLLPNPEKESGDATFTGTQIEWLKNGQRGKNGHIAIATSNLPLAREYLEEKGLEFDEESVKYLPDGRVLVIYAKREIGGFAIHLMQRS